MRMQDLPLHFLPAEARTKLVALDIRNAADKAAVSRLQGEAISLNDKVSQLRTNIERHREAARHVKLEEGKTDFLLSEYLQEQDVVSERQQALFAEANKLFDALTPMSRLLDNLKRYVGNLGAPTTLALPIKLTARDMGDLPEALAKVREEISTTNVKLLEASDAPLPVGDVIAATNRIVDEWASEGADKISVSEIIEGTGLPSLFSAYKSVKDHTAEDYRNALAFLFTDKIKDVLFTRIKEQMGTTAGLSRADRDLLIGKLTASRLASERKEEAIIMEMLARGIPAIRRENASPIAVLGLDA